jgi:hypothetical protein
MPSINIKTSRFSALHNESESMVSGTDNELNIELVISAKPNL